jgi:uncharacterized damage-inducible protein DinB
MRFVIAAFLFAAVASAQNETVNPLIATSKAIFNISKRDVMGSVETIPEDLWSFQPTKDIRTVAQLFAHIADGQYEFCGAAIEGKPVDKGVEKTAKGKAEIVKALNEAFAYCEAAYADLTDAKAAETVKFFGMTATRLGIMDFNVAHNMEHYGNLVTYMRLKGIVPPSSAPRAPAPAKK